MDAYQPFKPLSLVRQKILLVAAFDRVVESGVGFGEVGRGGAGVAEVAEGGAPFDMGGTNVKDGPGGGGVAATVDGVRSQSARPCRR